MHFRNYTNQTVFYSALSENKQDDLMCVAHVFFEGKTMQTESSDLICVWVKFMSGPVQSMKIPVSFTSPFLFGIKQIQFSRHIIQSILIYFIIY